MGDVEHHRHGSQRIGDTAGPRRLLPNHVEIQRNVFITAPLFDATHPHGGEDEVRTLQRRLQLGMGSHGRHVGESDGELLEDGGDRGQPTLVDVVEGYLGHPWRPLVANQRLPHIRGAESAPAEDRELHATMTFLPASRR